MSDSAVFVRPGADGGRIGRPGLSRREAEVLDLVVAHYGNAEIAHLLNISKRTVESHMAALLRKFTVADRAALMRAATSPRTVTPGMPSPPVEQRTHGHVEPPHAPASLHASHIRWAGPNDRPYHEKLIRRRTEALAARLRNSIRRHEALAIHLDKAAAQWRAQALLTTEPAARDRVLSRATRAVQEAGSARSRAARSRQLLDRITQHPRIVIEAS